MSLEKCAESAWRVRGPFLGLRQSTIGLFLFDKSLSRKFFFMFKERDEKYVEILFDNNITI
jgi:hypothetical protein